MGTNVVACVVLVTIVDVGDDRALDMMEDEASLAEAARESVNVEIWDLFEKKDPVEISSFSVSSLKVKLPILALKFSYVERRSQSISFLDRMSLKLCKSKNSYSNYNAKTRADFVTIAKLTH